MSRIFMNVNPDEFPQGYSRGSSGSPKYGDFIKACSELQVGAILKALLPNKKEAALHQSALQGAHGQRGVQSGVRETLRSKGMRFETRTVPANGAREGEWYIYVKRVS